MRGLGVDRQPTALGNFLEVGVAARPAAQAGLASAFQILGATYLMRTRARKGPNRALPAVLVAITTRTAGKGRRTRRGGGARGGGGGGAAGGGGGGRGAFAEDAFAGDGDDARFRGVVRFGDGSGGDGPGGDGPGGSGRGGGLGQDQAGRRLPHPLERQPYRGQRRVDVAQGADVVEPGQRDVGGHGHAARPQAGQRAPGPHVGDPAHAGRGRLPGGAQGGRLPPAPPPRE